ncbi:MAG: serine/threonine-protein kinase [Streptosporangiaceae bacterium]
MNFDRELLSAVLPAYEIGGELGQGGMGVVVSGQHRQLGRRVAIKQLPEAFAADPGVRRRFTAEAQVLASLDHPHVVPVYDFVEREGICLLVMELLPGGTLRSRVAGGGCTAPYAVAVSLACLSGLNAAHRRGILHRDVKPENMLFAASGVLKVTDFGIAKVIGGPGTVLTRVGDVVGTPAYIAPEQVRGGKLSPATDVYALATMLYELLADVLPFSTETEGDDLALLFKHAYEKPVPLRDVAPGVPGPVAAVVMRGLATEPADRFETAEAFGAALAESATQAWGPGWLAAEQVPIMDAGPMIGIAGHLSGPRPAAPPAGPTLSPAGPTLSTAGPGVSSAGPTLSPAGPTVSPAAATGPGAHADALSQAPTYGGEGIAAAPGAETAIPARTPSGRRPVVVAAVVVAVIIVIILAIFLLPKMFHVYKSSGGLGPRPGPPPATAQLR